MKRKTLQLCQFGRQFHVTQTSPRVNVEITFLEVIDTFSAKDKTHLETQIPKLYTMLI